MFGLFALFSAGGESLWERIVTWYQNSLIHELLTYFNERYFTVEFGTYENFSLGTGTATTARNIILGLAAGIIVAAIITAHVRIGLGGFVRKLLKTESLSPDSAKTLMELGYFRSSAIRRELAHGSILRMVVRCRETEESDKAELDTEKTSPQVKKTHTGYQKAPKINFSTAHFYIPEDLRYRADVRFDKTGSSWRAVAMAVVLTVIFTAALCYFLPDVLQLADNLITMFSPK